MRLLAAVSATFLIMWSAGCSTPPAQQAPPGASATTTGLLPPGAPTEGVRPPSDGLPPPAEPENGPPPPQAPPGRIVPVGRAPEGVVADAVTRTVAVAVRDPMQLVLVDADTGAITARTPLPGAVRHLQLAQPGGPVLVPVESANSLVRVDLPGGTAHPPVFTGTIPHDATENADGLVFVANEHGGTVTVLRDDRVVKVFTDSVQPAGLAPTGSFVGLLDVRKNDLTVYNADTLTIVGSTPAGRGPTHLVADKHGRLIAADTRGDTVRVFTALPTPHEVASIPQPGGPYGIAYDSVRDRLWVASSGTDEVFGYDMSQPEPVLVQRIPTVQNPYTLGVDTTTGRLFIAGVTAGVLQIVDPGA